MSDAGHTNITFNAPPVGATSNISIDSDIHDVRLGVEIKFDDGTVLTFNIDPSATLSWTRGNNVLISDLSIRTIAVEGTGPRLVYSDADPKPDEGV